MICYQVTLSCVILYSWLLYQYFKFGVLLITVTIAARSSHLHFIPAYGHVVPTVSHVAQLSSLSTFELQFSFSFVVFFFLLGHLQWICQCSSVIGHFLCLIFETLGTSQKLKTHVKCSHRLMNRGLKEVEKVRLKIC